MMRLLTITGFLITLAGCADQSQKQTTPVKRKSIDVKSATGEKLVLTWQPQTVATFHVFYVNGSKAMEIDSIVSTDPNFTSPQLTIDNRNMDSWPAKGSQACFYVVAENAGQLSDPSDQACVTL